MARHPDWFEHLENIRNLLQQSDSLEWLGRNEIKAIFQCSDRDSIRLLHRFGAQIHDDALSLLRTSLLSQLETVRNGASYSAFLGQRHNVAGQLTAARAESRARQFPVDFQPQEAEFAPELRQLPETITWRRTVPTGSARFEILYRDGADLMRQLAGFLSAAGGNREEFFAATEPRDESRQ